MSVVNRSVWELAEHRNSAFDPQHFILISVHFHTHDKVCAVSCSRKRSFAFSGLINRAFVVLINFGLAGLDGFEQHNRRKYMQHLSIALLEFLMVIVPLTALYEQAVYQTAVLWLKEPCDFLDVVPRGCEELVVERQSINGDCVLSSIVLQSCSQKRLCEVEAADPEYLGRRLVDPGVETLQSRDQVLDVARQRLQGRVRVLLPVVRH